MTAVRPRSVPRDREEKTPQKKKKTEFSVASNHTHTSSKRHGTPKPDGNYIAILGLGTRTYVALSRPTRRRDNKERVRTYVGAVRSGAEHTQTHTLARTQHTIHILTHTRSIGAPIRCASAHARTLARHTDAPGATRRGYGDGRPYFPRNLVIDRVHCCARLL